MALLLTQLCSEAVLYELKISFFFIAAVVMTVIKVKLIDVINML